MKVMLTQPDSRTGDMRADIASLVDGSPVPECDIAVLPELIGGTASTEEYESAIAELARSWNCWLVGGSHYLPMEHGLINSGVVCSPTGEITSTFHKSRPYGSELGNGVVPGEKSTVFEVDGRRVAVFICSDFWFSDALTQLDVNPDVILIPSFSITQKQDPSAARELWKHMTVSRAYEYAAYVGVSDWAHPCKFDGLSAAGVTGLVNPRPRGDVYHQAQSGRFGVYELDFDRLDSFRANRAERGFLGKAETERR